MSGSQGKIIILYMFNFEEVAIDLILISKILMI